jgi:hypothetical protein
MSDTDTIAYLPTLSSGQQSTYIPPSCLTHFDECNYAVCPLEFEDPSPVTKACGNMSSPDPAICCSTFHSYIRSRQKQILITNIQAINCATMFGSMLQKSGVKTDLYDLCNVDLKDFSLQGKFDKPLILIMKKNSFNKNKMKVPFLWKHF